MNNTQIRESVETFVQACLDYRVTMTKPDDNYRAEAVIAATDVIFEEGIKLVSNLLANLNDIARCARQNTLVETEVPDGYGR